MTNIAFIAGTYQPHRCGVAHYTARLREELSKHGVETVVLTTHAAAEAVNEPHVRGVVQDWRLADLFFLVQAVKSTNADILHIQHAAGTYGFQRPVFLLPLLLQVFGYRKPIITTIHEYGWWEWEPALIPPQLLEWLKVWGQRRRWWDREDGFLLTLSEAMITTNADAQRVILERLPNYSNRLYRIPIGANVEVAPIERVEARKWLRQQYQWSDNTTVITFFGFLHPVKGIESLLAAFKPVAAQKPVRLILVGGVESLALPREEAKKYSNKLHTLVEDLELTQRVAITGYLEAEAASYCLSGGDIGVLPFHHGVTLKSGSLLTLFAHGLPVVATRPDRPDFDLDDSLLYAVPPRNVEALTAALLKLVDDQKMRLRLAANGYNFVRRFTWTDIAQKHLDIYSRYQVSGVGF